MECRTCLNVTDELQDLFTEDCDLPHKIETISSIQILVNDQFPSKICQSCVTNVELLYDFRGVVRRSNMILESRVYSAQNEETGESGKHEITDTELIQIDEIKMESSEIESLDFNDPVESKDEITKEEVLTCRKSSRGKKSIVANKVYNCTECDFTTEHYNSLRTHRKRHKDRQELRSICNICGKSITTDNLSKHLSNHTDTPVTCKICGKVVKHKESLRGHMYMHKGITLQCTFCGKIFHNRQSYYKHLQRHKIHCSTMEKSNMKTKFYECLSEKPQKSNSFQLSTEKYCKLIEDVKSAKSGIKKESRDYWLLRHYDVVIANGREQLVVPSENEQVLYYITSEELFDILYETHEAINHRGRDKMKKEIAQRYKNITLLDIQTFLNLCLPCLQKRKSLGFNK